MCYIHVYIRILLNYMYVLCYIHIYIRILLIFEARANAWKARIRERNSQKELKSELSKTRSLKSCFYFFLESKQRVQ
jgi:hypothetical protein